MRKYENLKYSKGLFAMKREAGIMKLFEGTEKEYQRRHSEIWPELVESIKNCGGGNYSIFFNEKTNELFSYIEIEDEELWEKRAGSEVTKRWWAYMSDIMETNDDNSPVYKTINEVFHLD